MRRRGVRLGRARDGLVPVAGELMPEVAAKLTRLFDAHLSPRSGAGLHTDDERGGLRRVRRDPHRRPATPRRARRRHRHRRPLRRAPHHRRCRAHGARQRPRLRPRRRPRCRARRRRRDPDLAPRRPAHDLHRRHPDRRPSTTHGRIIALGSPERCFTPHQRRAITLRDGGCLIPGCSVPAAWCEIHHVIPDAHGGPTHPDNGVLLCWFHHRTIDTSGWGIRMLRGVPHIRPPAWLDPGGGWRPVTKSPTRTRRPSESRPGA